MTKDDEVKIDFCHFKVYKIFKNFHLHGRWIFLFSKKMAQIFAI